MAKTVLTVNDDAGQVSFTNAVNLTNTTYILGSSAGQYVYVGFRFVSVAIPQAATIRRAIIRLNLASINATTGTWKIAGEASDNSSAFTTDASNISGRSRTTDETAVNTLINDLADGYYEIDVTASVQEIMNRAGWSSGNALAIIAHTPSGAAMMTVSTSEHATNDDPQLEIVYSDSATSAVTSGAEENVDADWTNITNIRADDGNVATGTNLSTTETFTAKTFGISGPTGSDTIEEITVKIQFYAGAVAVKERLGVELSWDGGTSWSTKKFTLKASPTTPTDYYVSGGPSGWGHTFTSSELSDTNFRLRISPDSAATTTEYFIDVITVQVYYTSVGGAAIKRYTLTTLGVG